MEQQKVVLSIGLLVSNRIETIQKCLDSLMPIRERIPCELIVVDTGCGEEVRKIVNKYADVIAEFTWCNDFSKARNESLKYASGEWFLYLDDDEWFADTEELIAFFQNGEYRAYGYASYIQRNFLDANGSQFTDTWVERMVRMGRDTHFESRIHEYLAPTHGKHKNLRSKVYHYGYVFADDEAKQKHFERNRVLLEEMIREEPQKLRWRLQLLQEYRAIDDYEHMYRLGEAGLQMTAEYDDAVSNIYLGSFYAAKILAKIGQEKYSDAEQLCREAERDPRNTGLFRVFLCHSRAKSYFFLGEYDQSESSALQYLKLKEWFASHEEELYSQQIAPFVGECMDEVKQKEIYSLLICDGLKQGNVNYLKQYLQCLKWEEKQIYVFEKMAETLMEAMCTLPQKEVFLDTLRLMHGHAPLWNYFVGEVERWKAEGHEGAERIWSMLGEADAEWKQKRKEQEQLLELTDQIKGQLRTLIVNGMKQEALAIIGNVRSMLPEDEELLRLEQELEQTAAISQKMEENE